MNRADGRGAGRPAPPARPDPGLRRACARARSPTRRGRRGFSVPAMVEDGVPRWLYRSGRGWMTAEYSPCPPRPASGWRGEAAKGKQGGRTVEIQRLIGRALRSICEFEALGERTLWLDCDVIQADGGTLRRNLGRVRRRPPRARPLRPLESADGQPGRSRLGRRRRGSAVARSGLLGGLERGDGQNAVSDCRRAPRRGAGHGGARAVHTRRARLDDRSRRGRDRADHGCPGRRGRPRWRSTSSSGRACCASWWRRCSRA